MVSVTVNGKSKSFEEPPLIRELLENFEVSADAVAVEVNRKIVPRSAHAEFRLQEGDEIEIVTFVGGG